MAKREERFLFKDTILLLLSIMLYYMIMFLGLKEGLFRELQIFSLVPLLTTTYYFYKFCNSKIIKMIYDRKYIGPIMNIISKLILEVYIAQGLILSMINSRLNGIFPLNIIVAFLIILVVAYITNIIGKIFLQTLREKPYNWSSLLITRK
jgi:ABC-type Na+ efflux pump permease subunit